MLVLNVVCALVDIVLPLLQRYAIDRFIVGGTTQGIGGYFLFSVASSSCRRSPCSASPAAP